MEKKGCVQFPGRSTSQGVDFGAFPGVDRATGDVQKLGPDQRSQIYHQPNPGTNLSLGVDSGSLQGAEYWSEMGDKEQRREGEQARTCV